MKIPYYPGCSLRTTGRSLDISAVAVAKVLDIDMVELPKWNCCGTVFSLTEDDLMHHVAPVRNLIRVQEMNREGLVEDEYRLVTLCSMCFNTMKGAALRVKNHPEDLEKINNFMNREEDYEGKVQVVHLLEILKNEGFDKIREKVTRPLKGLVLAPYYGCMLLKPREIGIDDPEDPRITGDLLKELGADVVQNPYKKVCCGAYHTVADKQMVALTYRPSGIVLGLVLRVTQSMLVACPLRQRAEPLVIGAGRLKREVEVRQQSPADRERDRQKHNQRHGDAAHQREGQGPDEHGLTGKRRAHGGQEPGLGGGGQGAVRRS